MQSPSRKDGAGIRPRASARRTASKRVASTNKMQALVQQIPDQGLRMRILETFSDFRKLKKFGLVFEDHLPELAPNVF